MSRSAHEKNPFRNTWLFYVIIHSDAQTQRGFYDDEYLAHKIIRTTPAPIQNLLIHLPWCKVRDFSTEIPGHVLSYV